jgi:hypothetical protein
MREIARDTKSEITRMELPSTAEMKKLSSEKIASSMREALKTVPQDLYTALTDELVESGYSYRDIAAAALQLHFAVDVSAASIQPIEQRNEQSFSNKAYRGGAGRSVYSPKKPNRPRT